MTTTELCELNLTELSSEEMIETDAGHPALAALAFVGLCGGALLAGAAVGYGVYKLVEYVTSDE